MYITSSDKLYFIVNIQYIYLYSRVCLRMRTLSDEALFTTPLEEESVNDGVASPKRDVSGF